MGNIVVGVLYGGVVPTEVTSGDDSFLAKWDKGRAFKKLKLHTMSNGEQQFLLGFWVMIGGDNDRGARDISASCIPLTVVEKSREAKHAIQSWKILVEFAKANGVNLPHATFWLAPIEIA